MTFDVGTPESYAAFSAVGGFIGYVIWCERNKQAALAMSRRCHASHILRNVVVSGFLGVLVWLVAVRLGAQTDPIAYLATGVCGMLSIEAALIVLETARHAATDILRGIVRRMTDDRSAKD